MSEPRQYPQIPLIQRDKEIEKMRALSRAVVESSKRRVLYFQARGGLGKTRLLQEYPQIIAQARDGQKPLRLLSADIIDMYDFANWRPIEIERKIVDSLRSAAVAGGISDQDVDTIFEKYEGEYIYYHTIRGFSHKATEEAEKKLREVFIIAFNDLSQRIPIALRFDTFEIILNDRQPKFAFVFERETLSVDSSQSNTESNNPTIGVNSVSSSSSDTENYSDNIGVNIVLKWFNEVIPQLNAALILMAGRPPRASVDQINLNQIVPDIDICPLSIIKGRANIAKYLRATGSAISDDDDLLPYIEKITHGLPLLLTLYARTKWPATNNPARNTYEFEDDLIEKTFNLLDESPSLATSAVSLTARSTFVFCLYILACARRGITRKELRGIFEKLNVTPEEEEIYNLEDEMLIKTVSDWRRLKAGDADERGKKENSLLLLHDEIQILIDQSKKLDDLQYRYYILGYLCEASLEQVRDRAPDEQPLKLFSNHMYYELTRDIAVGYRTYTVYVDWLLRQRYIKEALILSGVFWNTISYPIDRGGEVEMPFYDRLAESLRVTIDDIRHGEDVRYVKRLRYSDQNAEAAAWAERLYAEMVADNVLPAEQGWIAPGDLPGVNDYVFADLCLTWASAMSQSRADREQAKRLLNILRRGLELKAAKQPPERSDELPLHKQLIYLRRTFFLGETYSIRGMLNANEQFFRQAVKDFEQSEQMFNEYQNTKIPSYRDEAHFAAAAYLNDDVNSDIAQVRNNLAYRSLDVGKLHEALKLSKQVIAEYIDQKPIASTYQQALFYNTNALILMRSNKYEEAGESLEKARSAANKSGVDRAQGLVAHARAMHTRAQWKRSGQLITSDVLKEINTDFAFAAEKLQEQAVPLSELLHDRARFVRDLVVFYRDQAELDRANDYWKDAKTYLDSALEEIQGIDSLGLRRANMLETRACLDIINDDYTSAEALLKEAQELFAGDDGMPSYAQIVAGKIALQRGLVSLHQGKIQESLREFAIALARIYVFALTVSEWRDQKTFEELIKRGVNQAIAADQLRAFVRAMSTETEAAPVKTSQLLPPRPIADYWPQAWERSLAFFTTLKGQIEAAITA